MEPYLPFLILFNLQVAENLGGRYKYIDLFYDVDKTQCNTGRWKNKLNIFVKLEQRSYKWAQN